MSERYFSGFEQHNALPNEQLRLASLLASVISQVMPYRKQGLLKIATVNLHFEPIPFNLEDRMFAYSMWEQLQSPPRQMKWDANNGSLISTREDN